MVPTHATRDNSERVQDGFGPSDRLVHAQQDRLQHGTPFRSSRLLAMFTASHWCPPLALPSKVSFWMPVGRPRVDAVGGSPDGRSSAKNGHPGVEGKFPVSGH